MLTLNRSFYSLIAILLISAITPSFSQTNQSELAQSIERGKYIATAADCVACHTDYSADKPIPFAGGVPFILPMGNIISSNITPSKAHGLGNYSFEDFKKAITRGKSPHRSLYPAMPYTEYSKISENDLNDLYHYFMEGVTAVDSSPNAQTGLNFPFSLPGLMPVWNLLFLDKGEFTEDASFTEIENRGKYLVDHLGHCTTCHTPRNSLMGLKKSSYLSGGFANGWFAPNITSDKKSGIGDWSEEMIIQFLQEGEIPGVSQAGGQMAEAVEHSFRHLSDDDIVAMARYLKKVPAISTPQAQSKSSMTSAADLETLEPTNYESTTNLGANIYQGACSTCHGIIGEGSRDLMLPPLMGNRIFSYPNPNNIVLAIANGIERRGATSEGSMPAFGIKVDSISSYLNNEEIAAVSNYVINTFGEGESKLTSQDVKLIRTGGSVPLLISAAPYLAIILPLLVIILLIAFFRRKRARK